MLGKDVKDMFLDFKPFTSDKKTLAEGIKIYAGLYYHSANLWRPEVGDYRVQFTYTGRDGEEVNNFCNIIVEKNAFFT